jgi:DNA-directed RNA polymerase specialized sigma24 family protein
MAPRAKRGDRAGANAVTRGPMSDEELDLFYRRIYLPLVRRATWKHKLVREDARDIVQDAFVLALTRLKPTGNPKAWLVQVVDHLSVNYRRRAIRRANLTTKWGPAAPRGTRTTEGDDPSEG